MNWRTISLRVPNKAQFCADFKKVQNYCMQKGTFCYRKTFFMGKVSKKAYFWKKNLWALLDAREMYAPF
jgi:hypothetical protein